jgi:RHS repeat-associated protein
MKGAQKVQSKFCAQSGTWTYTNDVLGNRLTKAPAGLSAAAATYGWEILNRMTSYRASGSQNASTYQYRADGMRVKKTVPGSTIKSTFYRYDGQMGIEEWELNEMTGDSLSLTRNTLGARGIDMIQRATATVNETSYPLYDAHGNMTTQLLKNGASFTVANEKSYDAWGGIGAGNSNPEYKGRYCANLGHTQDDESSLIYMRARYYEPSSGRFVSHYQKCEGANFFAYCGNDPIQFADESGNARGWAGLAQFVAMFAAVAVLACLITAVALASAGDYANALIAGMAGCALAGIANNYANMPNRFLDSSLDTVGSGISVGGVTGLLAILAMHLGGKLAATIATVLAGVQMGAKTQASIAVAALGLQSMICCAELASDFMENGTPGAQGR